MGNIRMSSGICLDKECLQMEKQPLRRNALRREGEHSVDTLFCPQSTWWCSAWQIHITATDVKHQRTSFTVARLL